MLFQLDARAVGERPDHRVSTAPAVPAFRERQRQPACGRTPKRDVIGLQFVVEHKLHVAEEPGCALLGGACAEGRARTAAVPSRSALGRSASRLFPWMASRIFR